MIPVETVYRPEPAQHHRRRWLHIFVPVFWSV